MQKLLSLALLATLVWTARAQVTVELVLDQEQFLRSESLPVRLRISNFSGQTLKMGADRGWLTFSIDNADNKALSRSGEIPMPKPFEIESSKTMSIRADLMPHFDLSKAGHYTVSARVSVPQLEKEIITDAKKFDIVTGTDLWKREFGVPGQTPPEVRQYVLQVANFLNKNKLYARITDASGEKVFRVFPLGLVMSFSSNTIEAQVDGSSNLHVLFQNYKDTFVYSVIAPDGEQLIRQTHEFAGDSRPHLRIEDEGRIRVNGGQRRILLSDLPPPRVANTNEISERN
ncbi:MAG TPA: hypothetical protein VK530_20715 [Candidatus Acidoferrum sp.]|nr:hypothetical protein [Candidatus Acidoferrum sp.]